MAEDEEPRRRRRYPPPTSPDGPGVIRICEACSYMWKSETAFTKGTRTRCPHCGAVVDGGSRVSLRPGQTTLPGAKGTRVP